MPIGGRVVDAHAYCELLTDQENLGYLPWPACRLQMTSTVPQQELS